MDKKQKRRAIIWAVVIVVLVLVIAYAAAKQPDWAHLNYWKAHFVETPDQIYRRSAGGYDAAAALALRRSEAAANPSAADHHRAATIIHRNIIAQEHRPRLGPDGQPTDEAREQSQLRHEMFGRAQRHYHAALAGLTDRTIAAEEAERAVRRFGLPARGDPAGAPAPPPTRAEPEEPGAEFIIEAALQFAFGGLETLLTADPILAIFFAEQVLGGGAGLVVAPDAGLAGAAEGRRAASIRTRRAAAAEAADGQGRAGRAHAFLDLSQRNTSDPQNSHDSSVNAAKRAIVDRLRADQGPYERLPILEQIVGEILQGSDAFTRDPRTARPRPLMAEKAVAVVRRALNGERSVATGATDEEVLRRVWARAEDPRNAGSRDALRQAAFDALVDSWEPGFQGEKIQCVEGRISRLIGSLTLLDCDERNSEMRRLEQHKNDIFAKAQGLIRAAAEEAAAQSADPALRAVGRSYLATTPGELAAAGEVPEAAEAAFVADTRRRIGQMVDDHVAALDKSVRGAIPPHALEGVKTEALAAI